MKRGQGGATATPIKAPKDQTVAVLSGGNPRIAKADGDAPVQAYVKVAFFCGAAL